MFRLVICLAIHFFCHSSLFAQLPDQKTPDQTYRLENENLAQTVTFSSGRWKSSDFFNKLSGVRSANFEPDFFRLRISKGTDKPSSGEVVIGSEFVLKKVSKPSPEKLTFFLEDDQHGLKVEASYFLGKTSHYCYKQLKVTVDRDLVLERIDVLVPKAADLFQPYQMKQITSKGAGKWRPGLGQPLYTKMSALFMGIEFPAATNYVKDQCGYCGYLYGRKVKAGQSHESYRAIVGVSDSPKFVQDAFFHYIDQVRIRPLRLQVQYNSWFDFGGGVNRKRFAESVQKINQELSIERQVPPLKAYVIDDGWQDKKGDWKKQVWPVGPKFDPDFSASIKATSQAKSQLGLWLSPGCLFGGKMAVPHLKARGLETLDPWMSMAGPKYMGELEQRMLELTRQGVGYFKLDGLFGHLNTRVFELNGDRYGLPAMPQLGTKGWKANDPRLNDSKFEGLKTYYLVAGTERLIEIFSEQHEINPDIYIVISNGAYLSPWWLMHVDAVWMINAGDAAKGSDRTKELVYRDGVYYSTWITEQTQFPLNSVFNHEPKKRSTGETKKAFAEYLWMNLSRGTGFVELYIKTNRLSEADWEVLANGLKWCHKTFPYFKRSRMHGGDPRKGEVYGYSGWNNDGGYLSFHNPSDTPATYSFTLDRSLGLTREAKQNEASYRIQTPLNNAAELTGRRYTYGENLTIQLKGKEVIVLDFLRQ